MIIILLFPTQFLASVSRKSKVEPETQININTSDASENEVSSSQHQLYSRYVSVSVVKYSDLDPWLFLDKLECLQCHTDMLKHHLLAVIGRY